MRSESLPITQIPHVSRLYTHYLTDFSKVLAYYGAPPLNTDWQKRKIADYPGERRERVAAILDAQNRGWNASEETLANIARLKAGASAVVTGQQVGLFGGPLYAILKAVTAVKLAEEATAAGVETVPVFWLATEDHDLAEVAFANIPTPSHLQKVTILPDAAEGAPISAIHLDEEITTAARTASELLGDSEVAGWLRESYVPGGTLGDAFARLFARLFAKYGLVLLDPANQELHEISKPLYLEAADRSREITDALLERNKELESRGYHAQVKVTNTSTLLFVIEDGVRTPIQQNNSHFLIGKKKISSEELRRRIGSAPQDVSPNALFRAVVQDHLLPTLAYVGGPAEVAYFAQSAAVYQKLLGQMTPILPRLSATLVEPRIARKLEKYHLVAPMAFHGEEVLTRTLAMHALPAELAAKFSSAKSTLEATLASLEAALKKLDPTIQDAAQRSAAKMHYQLRRLEQRAALAQQRRQQDITRHAHEISSALYPHHNLQEREVAGVYFVARYPDLIAHLKANACLQCPDHQVLYL